MMKTGEFVECYPATLMSERLSRQHGRPEDWDWDWELIHDDVTRSCREDE